MAKTGGKRTASAPKKRQTRFVKLRALHCFDEVHRRILQGWSLSALARWIQEEAKEYTDVKHSGLRNTLKNYRDSIPKAELIKERIPQVFEKATARVAEGLDELEELEKLYWMQLERIQIDLANEREAKKLLPSMTQEMRTARELLQAAAELRMDLGLRDRKLGTVDLDAHITAHAGERFPGTPAARVLTDPTKRQKLLGIVSQMAMLAEKGVIDVEATVRDLPDQEASE